MEARHDMANDPVSRKDSMPHLAAALAASLKAIDDDYKEEMREMRGLLAEAKQEAEKHEPDSMKIKALLGDATKMVQTFAGLDPVWQGVQRVARMLGFP
jgi:hypothetical protein